MLTSLKYYNLRIKKVKSRKKWPSFEGHRGKDVVGFNPKDSHTQTYKANDRGNIRKSSLCKYIDLSLLCLPPKLYPTFL